MQLYKLRYLAAKSVAEMLRRSFANIQVAVENDVNGVTVVADAAQQQRIADALGQLDVPSSTHVAATPAPYAAAVAAAASSDVAVDVVTLHAAIPGPNGSQSTNASDIASVVMQALSPSLPDLHITLYANQSQLLLTGSPNSIRVARELIDKLDALPKMVVLDVTILEVDDTVSKSLGLSLNPTVISTTYSETTPAAPASGGTAPPLLGLQPLSRTPLSLGVQLSLLIQTGKAKVIADPKLTTLSGRTASIRAGDNIAILTTTGGSVGTVATTQLVTFNTGVQLDVTPVINADNYVSVTLHPTVNNETSILNGVPQISTRDVQTTVALQEGQTLVIGGLIEDSINHDEQKIPVLGYLPLIGPLFTQTTVNGERNELIITVTPHIIDPLTVAPAVGPAVTAFPSPEPLATLAPGTTLPPQSAPAMLRSAPSSYIALPPSGAAPDGAQPSPAPQQAVTLATPAPFSPRAQSVFVYGQRPAAVPPAGPNDPPRIFFVQATPQLVRQGTSVSVEAVTSPNVTQVSVQLGSATIPLHQASPGLWDALVAFAMPTSQMTPQSSALLSAARSDGVAATVTIPFTLVR
jgi:Flp pilus assembly secretin CpaC